MRDTILDQLTSEQAGAPDFKNLATLDMFPENVGHKVSNELLGGMLASILSDSRPLENFQQRDTTKMQKNTLFRISAIQLIFCYCSIYPGYHNVKPDVLTIPKMCSLLGF